MAYTLPFAFSTGTAGQTGFTAQLTDSAGTNVGSAISSGFVDAGNGFYGWPISIPDGHVGFVKIIRNGSIVAYGEIAPEYGENLDAAVSTRLAAITGGAIYAAPSSSFEATVKNLTTGLVGTIGIRIVDGQGTTALARGTANIVEDLAGSGIYTATLTAPATLGRYSVIWDTGTVSPSTVATEPLIVTSATTVVVAGAGSSRWPPPA